MGGAWGDWRPVSYELRSCLHDRWVRFRTLPGSKRYAGSEEEYAGLIPELAQDHGLRFVPSR
jgi:hypothetical protein